MNEITVSLAGNLATEPEPRTTKTGEPVVSFRIVVNEQRYDASQGTYTDSASTFMTVTAWRSLAVNVAASLHKGEPVVVTGRLRVNKWTTQEGEARSTAEVTAYHVGHDLKFGRSSFSRPQRAAGWGGPVPAASPPAEPGPGEGFNAGPLTPAAEPAQTG
ncbi:single-stranded DNA-binding protein [Leekyejoonella antrihumi]|nr:single-stranded DNA-binding protein [Leekyejoonella antrihumi]